jgi:hypothetical protein
MKDITIPNKGAITMKTTIFTTPVITTELQPELATAAPTNPPTRVCEELDGSPNHHVNKFHAIAAINADAITVRLITSGLMTPLPIVVATFNGKTRKAIKLKNDAMTTAAKGERTFVETTVAIEFAES